MKLAVLFWCYKEPEICRERLELLRRYDPKRSVYVLYGGEPDDAPDFEKKLHGLFDDFWVFDAMPSSPGVSDAAHEPAGGERWKWYHGDLLLLQWYLSRGAHLEWDTVFVMQWDMLMFAPLKRIFPGLCRDEIYFSGLRPVAEIENKWDWTSPELYPEFRNNYLAFLDHLEKHHGYSAPPMACLAIIMVLPRVFFGKFAGVPQPELGFIEYKLPTYARLFGIRFCNTIHHKVWWDCNEPYSWRVALSAIQVEIKPITLALGRLLPGGNKIFHPYTRQLPTNTLGWVRLVLGSSYRDLRKWSKRQLESAIR